MEGGWLPWRIDKSKRDVFPDLDSYGKTLPPPPVGFYWSKKDDNTWELLQTKNKEDKLNQTQNANNIEQIKIDLNVETKKNLSPILVHTIMPTETLQGISLHYNVSITNIRRVNNFSGNSIQFMKTLKIPIESYDSTTFTQPDTPEVLTQKFKNMTNEGLLESKVYLEENNWDLEKALTQWKSDSNWEFNSKLKSLNTKELVINDKEEIENDIEVVPAEVHILSNEFAPVFVQLEPPQYNNMNNNTEQEQPLLG